MMIPDAMAKPSPQYVDSAPWCVTSLSTEATVMYTARSSKAIPTTHEALFSARFTRSRLAPRDSTTNRQSKTAQFAVKHAI